MCEAYVVQKLCLVSVISDFKKSCQELGLPMNSNSKLVTFFYYINYEAGCFLSLVLSFNFEHGNLHAMLCDAFYIDKR